MFTVYCLTQTYLNYFKYVKTYFYETLKLYAYKNFN